MVVHGASIGSTFSLCGNFGDSTFLKAYNVPKNMWIICTSFVGVFTSYGGLNLKGEGSSFTATAFSASRTSLTY